MNGARILVAGVSRAIPVPPIDLQRDYSQRLKAIDTYLAKLQNAAQHGASLRQAVTARAFSGELLA